MDGSHPLHDTEQKTWDDEDLSLSSPSAPLHQVCQEEEHFFS